MNENVNTNETVEVETEMTFDRAAATLEAFVDGSISDGADIREAVSYALRIMDRMKSENAVVLLPEDSAYTICEKLETARYFAINHNNPDKRTYHRIHKTFNEFELNKLGKLLLAVTMIDD